MDQEERRKFWVWEIGFVLFWGLVIYPSASVVFGFYAALLIHLGLTIFYAYTLFDFGRGSNIEMGVVISIIAVLVAILLPVYHRAQLNEQRHRQRQMTIEKHRVESNAVKH